MRAKGRPRHSRSVNVQDLTVRYGDAEILSGVTFSAESGQWTTIIGANGAGKSTILKAIVGVVPYDGSITFGKHAYRGRELARQVAYVPQRSEFPEGMTTAEYVLLGRTAHLNWFNHESKSDRDHVAAILDRLDLDSLADRAVAELSGGEAQRVGMARALVQEAGTLILDEPTSALDLGNQIAVLELVDELRVEHGLTVIAAMHDLTTASRFGHKTVLLEDGRVAADGPNAEVLSEELLSAHYGTPVKVMDAPDGGVVIVPLRQS